MCVVYSHSVHAILYLSLDIKNISLSSCLVADYSYTNKKSRVYTDRKRYRKLIEEGRYCYASNYLLDPWYLRDCSDNVHTV